MHVWAALTHEQQLLLLPVFGEFVGDTKLENNLKNVFRTVQQNVRGRARKVPRKYSMRQILRGCD